MSRLQLVFVLLALVAALLSGFCLAMVARTGRAIFILPGLFTFGLMLVSVFAASIEISSMSKRT